MGRTPPEAEHITHAHFPPFDELRTDDPTADFEPGPLQQGFGFDPEKVQISETGGAKDNRFKPGVDQLPVKPLLMAAEVADYGGRKYTPMNWRRGLSWSDQGGSMMRHILAWLDGEDLDPESGYHHLAHAATQALYTLEFIVAETGTDDRWVNHPLNPDTESDG